MRRLQEWLQHSDADLFKKVLHGLLVEAEAKALEALISSHANIGDQFEAIKETDEVIKLRRFLELIGTIETGTTVDNVEFEYHDTRIES